MCVRRVLVAVDVAAWRDCENPVVGEKIPRWIGRRVHFLFRDGRVGGDCRVRLHRLRQRRCRGGVNLGLSVVS